MTMFNVENTEKINIEEKLSSGDLYWSILFKRIMVTFILIFSISVAKCQHTVALETEMIANGKDPIAIACAYNIRTAEHKSITCDRYLVK